MLAARLCFAWGIPDVIGWLSETPKHVVDFWIAFDSVEPIGEQWRQTSETNSRLSQVAGLLALTTGVKFDAEEPDDCMPQRFQRAKKRIPQVAVKQEPKSEFEQVTACFGLSEVVKKYGRNNQPS